MKLAHVSPFPPARSGVADYARGLGRALSEFAEVAEYDPPDLKAIRASDAVLYQMGNSALHGRVYDAALRQPGVVVVHDAILHHFALGWFSRDRYIEEFVYNFGEWHRDLAADLWEHRHLCTTEARYFQYPMLRRLVERSGAVVVHNPAAKRMAREAVPEGADRAEIMEIPHFVEAREPLGDEERLAARRERGIRDDEVVVSCFGYLRPAKRLRSLLDAATSMELPVRVLLVGDFVDPQYEHALEPRLKASHVLRLPFAPPEEFRLLQNLTDICVNLRDPGAGESSGIAMEMMALGKPVLVTRSEETSGFPENTVIAVDAGEAETEMLLHYLYLLGGDAEMRRFVGEQGRRHVREHHSLKVVAEKYLKVIARHKTP